MNATHNEHHMKVDDGPFFMFRAQILGRLVQVLAKELQDA